MTMTKAIAIAMSLLLADGAVATAKHPLNADDLHRLQDVSAPSLSPDGQWLAYAVGHHNMDADKAIRDLWRVSFDGKRREQLTFSKTSSNTLPQWSPDGRWLAFLSDRDSDDETTQVWLMPRDGGEARKLSELKGGVSDFTWAPDSRQLALIASDDPGDAIVAPVDGKKEERKTAKPIVIDRYQFKNDTTGYLTHQRAHPYAFDIDARRATLLTPGDNDEWAPDGRNIVYATKRGVDPDRHLNSDLYLVEPHAGATERQLTTFQGSNLDPY